MNEVDQYIALTEFARKKFIEGGLPEGKICVKPNFVDPDPGAGRGEGDYVLFAGRLTKEKGILTLLRAWKTHRPPSRLRIIGDGPLKDQIEREVQGEAAIEYMGRKPLSEVYELMGSAMALVFPFEQQARGTSVHCSALVVRVDPRGDSFGVAATYEPVAFTPP